MLNVEAKEALRTIFLKLDVLYFEVDAKARDSREPLVFKKDRALADDKALSKATVDFVLARLDIKADPLPWPTSFTVVPVDPLVAPASAALSVPPAEPPLSAPTPTGPTERMATFEKLSSDAYSELEVVCPAGWEAGDVEHTKLLPTAELLPEPEPVPEPVLEPEPVPVDAIQPPAAAAAAVVVAQAQTTTSAATKANSTSKSTAKSAPLDKKGNKVAPAPVIDAKKKSTAAATKPTKGAGSRKVAPS